MSPDPQFSSVTIAITAEVKNLLPTGNYHVTVTTPGGKTETKTYAIGNKRFSVKKKYAPGARRKSPGGNAASGGPRNSGTGGPGSKDQPRHDRPAKCSRSRMEVRGNETIVYCSTG